MQSTIPSEVWIKMGEYLLSVMAVVLFSYYGLKYGLKDARERLDEHLAADKVAFEGIDGKLDKIQDGIVLVTRQLGEHGTELSLHDERTKRTAGVLEKLEVKLGTVADKLDTMRMTQERMAGRLESERGN